MDASFVEVFVEKRLKRLFGKKLGVSRGPVVNSKFIGIRPEIYLHAIRLEDFGGVMPDGAQITRQPAKGKSTFKGIAEERPARLVLLVSCVAGSYALLQEICRELSPSVLLALELLPRIPLGALSDESVQLHFDDFTSSLYIAELDRVVNDDIAYYSGELEFHLNGFIHVFLTKRGGLVGRKNTTRSKQVPKRRR